MIVGMSSAWGQELSIDFESTVDTYSDWSFSNMTSQVTNSNVKAHGGSYFGTTGGRETASITTTNKIPNPNSISFYVSKQTTNTTNSSWYVQVSEDNINWTNVKTQSATSMDRGTWVEVKQSLTNYSNVYVRVYYKGTTAVRCIDDVVLTTGTNGGSTSTKYSVSFNSGIDDNGTVSSDKTSAAVGEIVTLTAIPNDGYVVDEWHLTNTGGYDGKFETSTISDTQISFKMKDFDMKYYATFKVSTPLVTIPAPIFDVPAGSYNEAQLVLIDNYDANYMYFYTLDGTTPTWDENLDVSGSTSTYDKEEGIEINNTCTLNVVAVDEDGNQSAITTASYTILVTRTITWSVNGEITTKTVSDGDKITFSNPSTTSIYGKTFVGWVAEEISGTTDEAPAFVTSATATKDITYYAVFAKENEGGAPTLEKINSVDAVVPGTYSLIRSDDFSYLANDKVTASAPVQSKVEKDKEVIKINEDMTWSVTGNNSDGFVFTSTSDKSCYLWGSSTNEGIRICNTSTKANATQKWHVENDKKYGIVLYNNSDISNKRYLCAYGDQDWRNYVQAIMSNSYRPANLYKVVGGIFYSNYCTTVPEALKISLNSACHDEEGMVYGTYSSSKPFYVSGDIIVAKVAIVDGELLVDEYDEGDLVPANTGVMVSATDGGDYYVEVENDAEIAELAESVLDKANCLRPSGDEGITATAMAEAAPNCTYYRLTMHNGTDIGYWWGAENGAAFDLAANKAYLAVPKGASVKSNMWFGGVETSISAPEALNAENGVIYNLNGQRVSSATKGIYIKNGKKYLVK